MPGNTKNVDFLIIGSMKCATTSLYAHLRSHPDIYISEFDETGYFLEPNDDRNIKGLTNNEIRRHQDNNVKEAIRFFRKYLSPHVGHQTHGSA